MKISKGIDSFYELVTESDIVVDKTLFIRDILELEDKAVLITRPRRWGKSMNFDMLKRFLDIEVDCLGNKLESNSNSVLFSGGELLKDDEGRYNNYKNLPALKIAKLSNGKYMRKQGNAPVIHLSLKECKGDNYILAVESIRIHIINLYSKFKYLLNSSYLDDNQKKRFMQYHTGDVNEEALKDSLSFLSWILYDHFKKRVWVLIDEHDKPGSHFFTLDKFNELFEERKKVTSFITSMFARCGKSNDSVHKIVLTGVTDFIYREGQSGFNNLIVCGMEDKDFSCSYGLSEEEVKYILDHIKLNDQDRDIILTSMKDWYNGYLVPGINGELVSKYNIWSIMNHIREIAVHRRPIQPQSYWAKSGVPEILYRIKSMGVSEYFIENLCKISEGEDINVSTPDNDFDLLTNLDFAHSRVELVLYLLIQYGYINIVNERVRVPNVEVGNYLRKAIIPIWMEGKISKIWPGKTLDIIGESLCYKLNDYEKLERYLQELVSQVFRGNKTEFDFREMIGGIMRAYSVIHKKAYYMVLSEKAIGNKGRIDNIFYPIEDDLPVIIHEYKKINVTPNSNDLNKVLEEALWQIIERNYLLEPISKLRTHSHYKFNRIKIRGVLFIRDENIDKWSVKIKEEVLTIETASKVLVNIEQISSNKKFRNRSVKQFINAVT